MILVDTSVWVDHLRRGEPLMAQVLEANSVLIHPFVIGELACGNLKDRDSVLELLAALPRAKTADEQEILHFISKQSLMGLGIGYIDIHLLASAVISDGTLLWTRDARLQKVAQAMGLAYIESH